MFHTDTRQFLDLWTALSRGGVPSRVTFDPACLGPRLTRTLMIDASLASLPLRLAGDWIEAVHARSLGGVAFAELWDADARVAACAAALRARREGRPVVCHAAFGEQAVQITLAPMRGHSGAVDRLLASYAPEQPLILSVRDDRRMVLIAVEAIGAPRRPALNLATRHGRRVA